VLVTVVVTVALHFQHMQDIFLFSKISRPALCPAQPITVCGTGGFSSGAKAAWLEAEHSPVSIIEAKSRWISTKR